MDAFGAKDMQKRGNFISLMFFVMALGLFIIFWILGFVTNIIAQVGRVLLNSGVSSILMVYL